MTNVNDFKQCKKVRCVNNNGFQDLTVGKEYEALRVYGDNVVLIDDAGDEYQYDIRLFEPVAKDNEDLTTLLPNMQAMGNKEIEMTNLDNFLNCKKVRCVVDNWLAYLTTEKEYEVLHVAKYTVSIIDDSGDERVYDIGLFEPVIEANDELDSTPCETRTVAKFEVGDKVYCSLLDCIETVQAVIKDRILFSVNGEYMSVSTCCHATQENYEMLCKLYPHNRFEKPPVVLKGSDLCRAMLERGDKYVPCFFDDESYEKAIKDKNSVIIECTDLGDCVNYLVPFDPCTGEPLTAEQAGV